MILNTLGVRIRRIGRPSNIVRIQANKKRRAPKLLSRRNQSSSLHEPAPPSILSDSSAAATPPPTKEQLRTFFISQAVPFIGFGLMDQTVMLQAGHAIDLTIGVTFGLSTLTAAAFGQICSDAAGVLFGGTVEAFAKAAGLPRSNMTAAQRALPHVRRVKIAGNLVGVITGCTLGLLNFLIIDTERVSTLKLKQQSMSEEQEFSFEVEASNLVRDDATVLTVRGPDIDGVLASMTSALATTNCRLIELDAHRSKQDTASSKQQHAIEDVFVVVQRGTNEKIPDDELDDVAMVLLEATNAPVNMHTFKAQVRELEDHNAQLQSRMRKLEKTIQEKQIKVVKKRDTQRA